MVLYNQPYAVTTFAQIEIGSRSKIKKIVEISKTYKKHIEKDLNMSFDAAFKALIKDMTNPNEENLTFSEGVIDAINTRGYKFTSRIFKLSFDKHHGYVKGFKDPGDIQKDYVLFKRAQSQTIGFGLTGLLEEYIRLAQLPLVIQLLETMKVTATGEKLQEICRCIDTHTESYRHWINNIKVNLDKRFDELNIEGSTVFEKIVNLNMSLVMEEDESKRKALENFYTMNQNTIRKLHLQKYLGN